MIVESIGFMGRIVGSTQTPNWTLTPYIIQVLTLLLAPALFAASIYMIQGRIVLLTAGERLSMIRVSWLTKIFVIGDIFSFLLQCAGMTDPLPKVLHFIELLLQQRFKTRNYEFR